MSVEIDLKGRVAARLSEVNLRGARLACVLCASLMPAGILLDVITQPEHVVAFATMRIACALFCLSLLWIARLPFAQRHPVWFGAAPLIACCLAIEQMILVTLDSAGSPYYAGLSMCTLGIGLLYTWRWWQALVFAVSVLALWLLPIASHALVSPLDVRNFSNNLYFMLLTLIAAVASSEVRYRAACREIEAALRLEDSSRELVAAVERLSELDRQKSEFFANISHELRTPLTLILAPLDGLLSSVKEEESRLTLGIIYRNAERLLRLIDDLLDLARLDAGGFRLALAPVDLGAIAESVADSAIATARARGLTLRFDGTRANTEAWGDAHRLEIVLTNVVSNALKFTPAPGLIVVRVVRHETEVVVEVEDDGPGIAKTEQSLIFQRFYQVEGSARREQGGAGLGLALARELVELHGGSLILQPAQGGGSLFRIALRTGREHFHESAFEHRPTQPPVRPTQRWHELVSGPNIALGPSSLDIPARRGRRPRVLIAEDQPELRQFLKDILCAHFETLTVADGLSALELTRTERPDLVLTDVMMPKMSGLELCREIKRDPRLKRTPVLLLTARSGVDAALEGYDAGADDFVLKPFHARVLLARVQAHLNLRSLALQLADHARLALAGTLAAGVAHEVRNPINAILNAARLLAEEAPEGMPKKLLGIVDEGARRIVAIVASLDDHVRPSDVSGLSQSNLISGIDSSLELLEHRMQGIAVHRTYRDTPSVIGAVSELNQVFLNLLDNAVRAAPKNIWIEVHVQDHFAQVTVADDGPGISKDVEDHLFEPFVTTRSAGEGTGLGLYLCRRIVEDHDGQLTQMHRAHGGALFVVSLPTEDHPSCGKHTTTVPALLST